MCISTVDSSDSEVKMWAHFRGITRASASRTRQTVCLEMTFSGNPASQNLFLKNKKGKVQFIRNPLDPFESPAAF